MKNLTDGERLWIWRRRQGLSQKRAAKQCKCGISRYRRWELDQEQCSFSKIITDLTLHERAVLARRRSGKTALQISEDLGVSRYWLYRMENNESPADLLFSYWQIA